MLIINIYATKIFLDCLIGICSKVFFSYFLWFFETSSSSQIIGIGWFVFGIFDETVGGPRGVISSSEIISGSDTWRILTSKLGFSIPETSPVVFILTIVGIVFHIFMKKNTP